jgi:tRNA U34 5-methylaminomethyl-2-thiouridine-forming methyltransferase MnmC
MEEINIEITEDGSHTLYVPTLDEHYHSIHGAIQESSYVYIEAGLRACEKNEIHLLEIGFGTGLNAFLSLLESESGNIKIIYHTVEKYPLSLENASVLNYPSLIAPQHSEVFALLHSSPWETPIEISSRFSLVKHRLDFSKPAQFDPQIEFDVVFYDAFAPDKQPEMWTLEIFEKIFALCSRDAIFTTYCAKGAVRRTLQTAGFVVERLPGPPGKREMLRGRKI